MRAIDFWVILCYTGMFSALMEYIVILYLSTPSKENEEENQNHSKKKTIANAIERITKVLLPFYNIMFPVIFFTVCTLQGAN